MGYLKVERVFYEGDDYYYESPLFENGLNIIEGENGTGKSTFSNLLSFSLGNYVREFDKRESKKHTEIVNDKNNYVLTIVSINNKKYKLKRFFNDNRIFVEEDGEVQDYLIHRPQNDIKIFSDWLLEKLGIPVVEFFQGTAQSKLNFSDLFRLIYYDQKTVPEKIYKEARNDGNFVSDSEFMRKVIFQMLMGHEFSEYYQLIGKLNKDKRTKSTLKGREDGFVDIAKEFGYGKLYNETLDELKSSIDEKNLQLQRLEIYEEGLLKVDENPPESISKVRHYKKELIDIELKIENILSKVNRLYKEIHNIKILKENTMLEVTQIKKIILTHEELNLFSPDTCPYCVNKVTRKEGHCICGREISENEYEKFFYSTDEYLTILKSKQKSVETLDIAIQSCNDELSVFHQELEDLKKQKQSNLKLINESKKDAERNTNVAVIKEVQQKKFKLKEEINSLKQNYKVKKNFDEIRKLILSVESSIAKTNAMLINKERDAKREIKSQIEKFNEIYNSLLVDIKEDIYKARIDEENYMPIINEGEYKEASVDVPIRLMYFLTLLKLAIDDSKIPFPRFLLIDTPENLGIDKDNLEKSMAKFTTVEEGSEKNNYQIILTTGINKYPDEFLVFKRGRSLNINQKLLSKKQ
ncbi:hypothetical protein PDQ75_00770 [Bacillus cereus group sp. Bc015]|uniref:hypothetical protein n=1 Tax=Bacillus cereus group sp. Bc015 TaxID=3018123 RepID=UPI0022E3C630|nr:hypothetical protein [Bacillus cereus group sp. Bc015]MDA2733677.1 hypothetical protein [Bacillus cereus group sp. Bc015]